MSDNKDLEENKDTPVVTEVEEKNQPNMVPEARVGELVAQRNQEREANIRYQNENAQLREQLMELMTPPPKTEAQVDIDALRKDLIDATVEGETEKALRLQERLESINLAKIETTIQKTMASMREDVVKEVTTKNDQSTYNSLIKKAVQDNSELDKNATNYNADLTERVNQLTQGFYNSGMGMTEALSKALDLSIEVKPKGLGIEQRKSNIAEEQNRPPALKTEANKAHLDDAVDISKMSDNQFREFMKDDEAFKKAAGYYN